MTTSSAILSTVSLISEPSGGKCASPVLLRLAPNLFLLFYGHISALAMGLTAAAMGKGSCRGYSAQPYSVMMRPSRSTWSQRRSKYDHKRPSIRKANPRPPVINIHIHCIFDISVGSAKFFFVGLMLTSYATATATRFLLCGNAHDMQVFPLMFFQVLLCILCSPIQKQRKFHS
jgi:hypothetical protein